MKAIAFTKSGIFLDKKLLEIFPVDVIIKLNVSTILELKVILAANVWGLPQFGYLMLCLPGDDAIKERKFDENEKTIAKRSPP
ncbi:MAG TPA: hypothetical protein VK498_08685 [Ferruginibacter sp.]|nr:hypothetical protein [Ferruginibacter sp.]